MSQGNQEREVGYNRREDEQGRGKTLEISTFARGAEKKRRERRMGIKGEEEGGRG